MRPRAPFIVPLSTGDSVILAVIPARLGATRLPRKPLRDLAGKPVIVRVWERVRDLGVADRCVVATDSEEVASAVRAAGGDCVMTRDSHPSGTDRVAEVAARPEFRGFDAIVNVQGDEPFVQREAIAGAVDMVAGGRFPLGTAAARAEQEILGQPQVVKVVTADDGRALYFSRAPIPFLRDPSDEPVARMLVRQHIGVYAYTRDALRAWVALPTHPLEQVERLEQLRPLAAGIAMGVAEVDAPPRGGIDTEDDLARASAHWEDFSRERG
ncbi:MAG TPA: 3-deoxy-manno-octulosonate cytidylyltransferase [Gemmatimonadaceae bacterium]|nr:3-deoxy-manno-octulosonate cytidylyltransferase [Gemmatimonadaceae bacterium]